MAVQYTEFFMFTSIGLFPSESGASMSIHCFHPLILTSIGHGSAVHGVLHVHIDRVVSLRVRSIYVHPLLPPTHSHLHWPRQCSTRSSSCSHRSGCFPPSQ